MEKNLTAYQYLQNRGVTRLCHFTKTTSLIEILTNGNGILATAFIPADVKNANDPQRLDGKPDHVCCSVEYPNRWYWSKVRDRDRDEFFREWAVFTIKPEILKTAKFLFCPVNSALDGGRHIREDVEKIGEIFGPACGRVRRPAGMLECCPTNDQAEILIYKSVPMEYINSVIVGNEDCADNVSAILKTIGVPLPVFVSPSVCGREWGEEVRRGGRPVETAYPYETR